MSQWIDLEKEVLKYHRLLNLVVSLRGHGKTSAAKKLAISNYEKTGKKTLWVRRYKKELGAKFYARFATDFETIGIENPNKYIMRNGELVEDLGDKKYETVIKFSTLSQSLYEKSDNFSQYNIMIFDEFLITKSNINYMPDEVNVFLEYLNTVMRFREDFTVLLMGNHVTNYNPYYNYFNITVDPTKENFILRKEFLFKFVRSQEFEEFSKKSRFADVVKDTPYYDYAYEGAANRESRNIVQRRPNKTTVMCNIMHRHKKYTLYFCSDETSLYIDNFVDNKAVTLNTYQEDGEPGTTFYRADTVKTLSRLIKTICNNNMIFAANNKVAQDAQEIINVFS